MLIEEIEIELTSICNAKCQLCYRNYKSYKPSKIIRPIDDVISQLDSYKSLKRIKLVGVESEPTIHPEFLKLITWLKSKDIHIEICTNGDTKTVDFWRKLGILLDEDDEVYFTICGSTQELHQRYRRNTRLDRILRNAAAMREAGKSTDYAQCIRFSYNDKDFNSKKFQDMVSNFSHVYWTETYLHKDLNNYVDIEGMEYLTPPTQKQDSYYKVELLANALFKADGFKETLCMAEESKSIQIDVHGNLYPCYLHKEADIPWTGEYGNGEIETCKFCIKGVRQLCHDKQLEYVI